jgi:multiple sugar transport system ATP-binding protein
MHGVAKPERDKAMHDVAKLLQIENLLDRKPGQLSGGQRQRVAMGRALVRNPDVFLFDEPLSNLDAKLRVDMRTEIKKLHQKLGTTIVYVTHDQIEAMTLSTRIAVMYDGYVQQLGTPKEIYDTPSNLFVATFMGSPAMNVLPARLVDQNGALHAMITGADGNELGFADRGCARGIRGLSRQTRFPGFGPRRSPTRRARTAMRATFSR